MESDIQREVERVIGGKGVEVRDAESSEAANPRVRLETADAVYTLPSNRFLILLRGMPDGAGINALRQTIDEHFPQTR